jgi:hypothetical protein
MRNSVSVHPAPRPASSRPPLIECGETLGGYCGMAKQIAQCQVAHADLPGRIRNDRRDGNRIVEERLWIALAFWPLEHKMVREDDEVMAHSLGGLCEVANLGWFHAKQLKSVLHWSLRMARV